MTAAGFSTVGCNPRLLLTGYTWMYVCAIAVEAYFRLTWPGPPRRCTIAPILVSAMAFVETRIGLPHWHRVGLLLVCAHTGMRPNAGKSSWKRTVFESEVEDRSVDWPRVSGTRT